jgi:nucleoid-associated protein YgaU
MGLYDFIKAAGKKLGIGKDDEPTAEALKKELDSHKLGTENVTVELKGDKAILKGDVASQEALEKAIVAVGNTLGISQVESNVKLAIQSAAPSVAAATGEPAAAAAPAVQPKEPRFHTVKKGDTLWEIAEAVYGKGHGKDNKKIFEANKPMLKHPDKIYPGQVLRIPD